MECPKCGCLIDGEMHQAVLVHHRGAIATDDVAIANFRCHCGYWFEFTKSVQDDWEAWVNRNIDHEFFSV